MHLDTAVSMNCRPKLNWELALVFQQRKKKEKASSGQPDLDSLNVVPLLQPNYKSFRCNLINPSIPQFVRS